MSKKLLGSSMPTASIHRMQRYYERGRHPKSSIVVSILQIHPVILVHIRRDD